MSRAVFADTSFFHALLNEKDAWHAAAEKSLRTLSSGMVTTEYVLVELGASMSSCAYRVAYVNFVAALRKAPHSTIIPASTELFTSGLHLFSTRADKEWSLCDCVSFVIMEREGITDALTADHHFVQAGFKALLLN